MKIFLLKHKNHICLISISKVCFPMIKSVTPNEKKKLNGKELINTRSSVSFHVLNILNLKFSNFFSKNYTNKYSIKNDLWFNQIFLCKKVYNEFTDRIQTVHKEIFTNTIFYCDYFNFTHS